jgi:hypothetical protein
MFEKTKEVMKQKLQIHIDQGGRVSLTTDTWFYGCDSSLYRRQNLYQPVFYSRRCRAYGASSFWYLHVLGALEDH